MKKLTTLFVIVNAFLITGCISISFRQPPSRFPPAPKTIEYTKDPVLSFNEKNETYIITSEYMLNSLQNDIYLKNIKEWKEKNDIR